MAMLPLEHLSIVIVDA